MSVEVNLDTDARQHGDGRLSDSFIVNIAIIWAIHAEFEAVRVACFSQKLLCTLGFIGVALEALCVRKHNGEIMIAEGVERFRITFL